MLLKKWLDGRISTRLAIVLGGMALILWMFSGGSGASYPAAYGQQGYSQGGYGADQSWVHRTDHGGGSGSYVGGDGQTFYFLGSDGSSYISGG